MDVLVNEVAALQRRSGAPRVAVLINESAGSAEPALRGRIVAAFATHRIDADLQVVAGDGMKAAAERAAASSDAVVVGGGDGSIRTVASVLVGSSVPLGVLPLGTFNHFAKDLRLPLDVEAAVAVIARGQTSAIDVGEVSGRVFINNSSIGLYPFLVLDRERERRRSGLPKRLAMVLAGLRALRRFPRHRLVIHADGEARTYRSPCVFIGNNDYCVSGLSLGTRACLDDGRLCLFIARRQSAFGLFILALRCLVGLLDEERDLRSLSVTAVDITYRHGSLLVACDGEVERLAPPLHYRIRPKALRVFADPSS